MFSCRSHRRLLVLTVVAGLILASCGGDGERSRNVETIAATACTKKGATKTVSKVNYVCGTAPNGKVWFSVVGKLTTKGAKACKPLGKYEAAKSRVCGTVKKSSVWVKVAPLPVAATGVGDVTTTLPSDTTNPAASDSTTSPVPGAKGPKVSDDATAQGNKEVLEALVPAPPAKTIEAFREQLVPRPVEAQAVALVPTSIKVEGGSTAITNGAKISKPFTVTVLDQKGNPLALGGNEIYATVARTNLVVTGSVAKTDDGGTATFTDLRLTGVVGPEVVTFTADFGATIDAPVEIVPGPATEVRVQNHPTKIVVFEELQVNPTVVLVDKSGNETSDGGVEITASLNDKVIATAKTDAKGAATFRGVKISEKLSSPKGLSTKIVYAVPSMPTVVAGSVDVTLGPGSPNDLAVSTAPSTVARAGIPLDRQPVVRIVDANGNPVAMKGVPVLAYFDCRRFCDADGSSQTVKTDEDGVARFTNLTLRGWSSEYNVAYVASDYDSGFSVGKIGSVVEVFSGEAASIGVFEKASIFPSGVEVESPFLLQVIDAWGNLISDYNGTLSVTSDRDIGILTRGELKFQDGEVRVKNLTIKGKAGPLGITFQSGGFVSDLIEVSVVAGSPAKFEILTPAGTITAGSKFENSLAVRLLDSDDNPIEVPNIQVALSSSAGTGSREIGLTNERGIASFVPAPIEKAGKVTLLYSDPAGKVDSAQDVLTVVPAAANSTRLVSGILILERSGVTFYSKPTVQLIDSFDNAVLQADVSVTASKLWSSCAGELTATNGVVKTNANGIATFNALSMTGPACRYVVGFRPSGGTIGAPLDLTLLAGLPAGLSIVRQPSGAVNSKALTTQPVVQLKDADGNNSSQEDVVVSTTLDGEVFTAKTDGRGIATFTDVTAKGTVGDRTLTFTSTGLESVTSSTFAMAPGDVAQVVPGMSSITISQAGQIPSVLLKDASGNLIVSNPSVAVSLTSSSGTTSWIMGSASASSTNGRAQFPETKISSTASTATLRYSISGRTVGVDVPVSFSQPPVRGQIGPSGGQIIEAFSTSTQSWSNRARTAFYFVKSVDVTSGGKYVEVAPRGWASSDPGQTNDPQYKWAFSTFSSTDRFEEGTGYAGANTANILNGISRLPISSHTFTSAAEAAASLDRYGYNDWLLPTSEEMKLIIDGSANGLFQDVGLVVATGGAKYWTSSTFNGQPVVRAGRDAIKQLFTMPPEAMNYVRPVRYFN